MEGIEKELGAYLDQYKKKQEENRENRSKEHEEYITRENEFKDLFKTIVYPIMVDYVNYLDSKGDEFEGSHIKGDPHFAGIMFGFNVLNVGEGRHRFAEITFSRQDEKVRIVERNQTGSNSETTLDKSDLTPDFVRKRLSEFTKSFYRTEDV